MRILILSFCMLLFGYPAFSSAKTDSLLAALKTEIARKKIYDGEKEKRIKTLKQELQTASASNFTTQYDIYGKLFEEYKVYQFDSAYVYVQKMLTIAQANKDMPRLYKSKIKLSFILITAGMFKETFDCLNQINAAKLSDSSKVEYYVLKARAYSDMALYDNDKNYTPLYNAQAVGILDSAIALLKPNSFDLLYALGEKQIRTGQVSQPSPYYMKLMDHYSLTPHQRAQVATGLSFFYGRADQSETRTNLLTIGAINDIRSSTKETMAIFELGQQLYRDGNVKDAYIFIQQAMEDAQYYGARLRTIQIGAVLPVVASHRIIATEKEKNKFLVYLLAITVVAILIALVSFIIFIQLKRLKVKERIIEEKNIQLEKINDKLSEDTHIKEQYIGYFFSVISGYILRLEKLKRSVERKLVTKKYDEISVSFAEINVKKERETLFYTFDRIFLKIFPNFITAFNSLLKKEDQVWPKDNEALNPDLRIFALVRLGIRDNETIANILEYTVNTVYVYKARIKAKALVPADQFDNKIMAIKAVDVLKKP